VSHRVESGLRRRAFHGIAWTGGGVAAEMAFQAAVIMILARLLVPADFGIVSIALVATGFVGIFGEFGLIPALIQRERLEPAHLRTAFTGSLAFAVLIGAALWIASPWVARFFGIPAVASMMCALALAPCLRAWASVPSAMLQRAMRFRDISLANVVSYVVGFGVVGVGMGLAGLGAWSLVGAHLVQAVVYGVVLHLAWPVSHRPGLDRAALRDLLGYGGGISFARLSNYVATRGDNMVVGYALGPTALGLYGPAYHLMALPADLFQRVVQTVLFPAIARLQTEPARLAAAYRRGLALTALVALPGTLLAILLAPEMVDVVLGPRWRGVVAPLQVLAAGMFFRVGYKTSVVFVKAVGAVRPFVLRQAAYPLLVLSLAWLGSGWGITGALPVPDHPRAAGRPPHHPRLRRRPPARAFAERGDSPPRLAHRHGGASGPGARLGLPRHRGRAHRSDGGGVDRVAAQCRAGSGRHLAPSRAGGRRVARARASADRDRPGCGPVTA
jgi:O-antigen/teichoic acid export membrane protein